MLYYAQAWYLALKDRPLFREDIQAWFHGPAVPSIYNKYRKFGFEHLSEELDQKELEPLKKDELLAEVWKVYGKLDAEYLEALTHNEAPWQKAREGLNAADPSTKVISHNDMKEFYKHLKHA